MLICEEGLRVINLRCLYPMPLYCDRLSPYSRPKCVLSALIGNMAVFEKFFIWWSGATLGTVWTIFRSATQVGTDEFGNKYYEALTTKESYGDKKRRYVIYKGYADASKIPPDWHGWMHYMYDERPSDTPLPKKSWEKSHLPNFSGTPFARFPSGSLNSESERQKASGDYESWKP
jgi:NADH:ubiquinone oxidoreductase subunit